MIVNVELRIGSLDGLHAFHPMSGSSASKHGCVSEDKMCLGSMIGMHSSFFFNIRTVRHSKIMRNKLQVTWRASWNKWLLGSLSQIGIERRYITNMSYIQMEKSNSFMLAESTSKGFGYTVGESWVVITTMSNDYYINQLLARFAKQLPQSTMYKKSYQGFPTMFMSLETKISYV